MAEGMAGDFVSGIAVAHLGKLLLGCGQELFAIEMECGFDTIGVKEFYQAGIPNIAVIIAEGDDSSLAAGVYMKLNHKLHRLIYCAVILSR